MSDIESIIDRHARRPGYSLATYREVALPFWKFSLQCRVLRRKRVSAIDEFVLRSISSGLRTDSEVERFLGLPARVVEGTMGALVSSGHLSPASIGPDNSVGFALTARGTLAVQDLTVQLPEERTLELAYDGLLRSFTVVDPSARWRPRDLARAGLLEIPAFPADPPEAGPKDTPEVSAVLSDVLAKTGSELLSVLGLASNREKFFVKALALVFQPDGHQGDPAVTFLVDGRPSPEHDDAFSAAEGRRKLGLLDQLEVDGLSATQREVSHELLAQLPDPEEVANLRQVTGILRQRHERRASESDQFDGVGRIEPTVDDSSINLESAEALLDELPARILEVHEHPGYLRDALENAQERLLIVAPWIRAGVVDQVFREKLEHLLEAGVEVGIAHGIDDGAKTPEWDKRAEEELDKLAGTYPNFTFTRLGDTHAKVLVVDDRYVIVTSFNWLSFRGDPNLPFRDERGTLVTVRPEIDRIYADYRARMARTDS